MRTTQLPGTWVSLILVIALAVPASMAQEENGLKGQVIRADGQPLAEVTVSLLHLASRERQIVLTDAEGRYELNPKHAGHYLVMARHDDFMEKGHALHLEPGQSQAQDFRLRAPETNRQPVAEDPPSSRS
ncbi:MAG: carboxypeptidase-like regulatory domain-containing protein [Acidobacteriota bacterium]